MYFKGRFVLTFIDFAVRQGADIRTLLRITGHSEERLSSEDCKLNDDSFFLLVEEAMSMINDRFLGLHFGEQMNLSAHGLLLQIMQSSSTIKEALEYVCQFSNLSCSAIQMKLITEGEHVQLTFNPDPIWLEKSGHTAQQTVDGLLVFTLREIRNLTRTYEQPFIRINYGFPKPSDSRELERVLDSAIHFNTPFTSIILLKNDVEKQVLTKDRNLLEVLVNHASKRLSELMEERGFADQLRKVILHLSKPEFPEIEEVASNFNLSVRTLQRKLKEEGITYKQLTEQLKCELALAYLSKKDLTIHSICYQLNYADPSSFGRSFKKWTGKTPAAFRLGL